MLQFFSPDSCTLCQRSTCRDPVCHFLYCLKSQSCLMLLTSKLVFVISQLILLKLISTLILVTILSTIFLLVDTLTKFQEVKAHYLSEIMKKVFLYLIKIKIKIKTFFKNIKYSNCKKDKKCQRKSLPDKTTPKCSLSFFCAVELVQLESSRIVGVESKIFHTTIAHKP